MGAPVTLDRIRYEEEADLYPTDALTGLSTAFMGFCAGFLGRQDCVWVADARLDATCVDIDLERLDEMTPMYPAAWRFVHADVFEYARQRYAQGARFDVVSLDPPTNLFDRVADTVDLWCRLARQVVIVGTARGTPLGWHISSVIRRSHYQGGTYWTVLERR